MADVDIGGVMDAGARLKRKPPPGCYVRVGSHAHGTLARWMADPNGPMAIAATLSKGPDEHEQGSAADEWRPVVLLTPELTALVAAACGGCSPMGADRTAAELADRDTLAAELWHWRRAVEDVARELDKFHTRPGANPPETIRVGDVVRELLRRDAAAAAEVAQEINQGNKYAYHAGASLHECQTDRDKWRERAEKAENELRGARADLDAAREDARTYLNERGEARVEAVKLRNERADAIARRDWLRVRAGVALQALRALIAGEPEGKVPVLAREAHDVLAEALERYVTPGPEPTATEEPAAEAARRFARSNVRLRDAIRNAADDLDAARNPSFVTDVVNRLRSTLAHVDMTAAEPAVSFADLERVARRMQSVLVTIPGDFHPEGPKVMSAADVGERLALAVARLVTAHHERGRELDKLRSESQAVAQNQAAAARMDDEPPPGFAVLCRDLITHRSEDGDGGRYWEVETVARRCLSAVGLPVSRPASADDEKGPGEPEPDGDDTPAEPDTTAAELEAISRRLTSLTELVMQQGASIGKLTDAVGLLTARAVGKPLAEVDPVAARGREVLARFRSLEERARRVARAMPAATSRRTFMHAIDLMVSYLRSWEDAHAIGRPLSAQANAAGAERAAELVCGHLEEKYDAGAYKIPDDFRG